MGDLKGLTVEEVASGIEQLLLNDKDRKYEGSLRDVATPRLEARQGQIHPARFRGGAVSLSIEAICFSEKTDAGGVDVCGRFWHYIPLIASVVEWQTRMIQVHMPRGVGVQVPPDAPYICKYPV